MSFGQKAAFLALGAAGAAVVTSYVTKTSQTQHIANAVRSQMDDFNSHVQPEQERNATLFDRTQLLNDAKARKPWNRTYAEAKRHEDSDGMPLHWIDELRRSLEFGKAF